MFQPVSSAGDTVKYFRHSPRNNTTSDDVQLDVRERPFAMYDYVQDRRATKSVQGKTGMRLGVPQKYRPGSHYSRTASRWNLS